MNALRLLSTPSATAMAGRARVCITSVTNLFGSKKVSTTVRSLAVLFVSFGVVGCSTASLSLERLSGADWALTAVNGSVEKNYQQSVAVLDGGISSAALIVSSVVESWQADSLDGKPRGTHGNEVAALIAGEGTSVQGKVDLLDVRVLNADGIGTPEDIAEGILWSVSAGADIISMSFRLESDNRQVRSAVQLAQEAGVIIVASAANDFLESPTYPAEYPGVIGITSINRNLERAQLARSRGADVAVPGQDIQTKSSRDEMVVVSGTSMATALATSVISKCLDPGLDSGEILSYADSLDTKILFDKRKLPLLRCP